MTTLSLFEEPAAFEPGSSPRPSARDEAALVAARTAARMAGRAPAASRPTRAGGLTLPVLALAALVASPAIWQCVVRHELPPHVMLERYVLIAVGCLVVSEVVRRLLPATAGADDAGSDLTAMTADGQPDGESDGGPTSGPTSGPIRAAEGVRRADPSPADTPLMHDLTDV